MKTFFLEQAKNTGIFKFKIVEQRENKIILNKDILNLKISKKIKIAKKIKIILQGQNCKQIAVQENLKKDTEFMNLLHSSNINICNSKWFFKQMTDEVIKNSLNDIKKEESEISICINDPDSLTEQYINKFAKEFKGLNIVTNHIGKFKKIEEKLYNDQGILITITNNKRKSLSKSKLILNIDFPKEIINQFNIYDNATIITWEDNIKILKKRFNGKIISDYNIEFDEQDDVVKFAIENQLEGYDLRDICQVIEYVPKQ